LAINFIEVFYKIMSGIVLYKPMIGEIIILNKKRMLSIRLLKKIYFLY